jgi:hypothetical protein
MKETPGEEHDHRHHRSLWFAHGAMNGHDFWSEQKAFGKTVHEGFVAGDATAYYRHRDHRMDRQL